VSLHTILIGLMGTIYEQYLATLA